MPLRLINDRDIPAWQALWAVHAQIQRHLTDRFADELPDDLLF